MAVLTSTGLEAYQLSAADYGEIVNSGALEGKRVELIDGIIVKRSPRSPEHAGIIAFLTAYLHGAGQVRPQLPLLVSEYSVPEPDLAVVAGTVDFKRHPTTAQLVIEVAHSCQRLDRGRKQELYAAAGIPQYWVVDIVARTVEVRTDPREAGYGTTVVYRPGETVPSPLPGVEPLTIARLFAGLD